MLETMTLDEKLAISNRAYEQPQCRPIWQKY